MTLATLKPMLVSAGPLRPDRDKYAIEVKWDGFGALVNASPQGGVTITSRNGYDMTGRYPELEGRANAATAVYGFVKL